MGMYDIVLPEINLVVQKCPKCKCKLDSYQEWQTKSFERLLLNVSLRTLRNSCKNFEAHMVCENCNTYVKLEYLQNKKLMLSYDDNEKHNIHCKYIDNKSQLKLFDILSKDKEGFDFGGDKHEDI